MAGLTQEAMTPLERAKMDVQQYSIDHEPSRWADGHMLLSQQYDHAVLNSSSPTRAADKGIEHLEAALKWYTEEHDAPMFALAQSILARVYPKRVAGSRPENLTKALACAETALRICKDPSFPFPFVVELHEAIGSIYADEDFGSSNSRAANEDLAIRHYLASLESSSMTDDNDKWANRQLGVGLVYYDRKNGKRRSNLKVAITHLVEALKVFTKSEYLRSWVTTHEYLALSYFVLVTVDPAASSAKMSEEEFAEKQSKLVEKLIASCTNALQVYTPTYGPTSW
jgi:hypothetical protein